MKRRRIKRTFWRNLWSVGSFSFHSQCPNNLLNWNLEKLIVDFSHFIYIRGYFFIILFYFSKFYSFILSNWFLHMISHIIWIPWKKVRSLLFWRRKWKNINKYTQKKEDILKENRNSSNAISMSSLHSVLYIFLNIIHSLCGV